jgi:hypothetical protein
MRVIECDTCGEVLSGASDAELARRLRDHLTTEHPDLAIDEQAARKLVDSDAYEATDS